MTRPIYCVKKEDGTLLPFTISESRRAVIVNYLIEERHQRVYNSDTDDYVETLWRGFANGATIVAITLKEVAPPPPVAEPETALLKLMGEDTIV
jgi:hypothetical protein